jgi:hypothetical protein
MLCELSPVLAEAAQKILVESADMTFVGEEMLRQVEHSVRSRRLDALLLGSASPADPEPSRHLLDENPLLKIVCVAPDGREAVLQERRFDRTRIENVSFDRIISALRVACAAEGAG